MNKENFQNLYAKHLCMETFEHDACGIGAVVDIKGRQTHKTVDDALKIVEKLEHRAGKDASGETGDGVGILLQICHPFFKKVCSTLKIELKESRDYGVGMFFFPQDSASYDSAKKTFSDIAIKEGLKILGWRKVPTNQSILGKRALDCMPLIMQCFIERPKNIERGFKFDQKLYTLRRLFEKNNNDTYVVSLSSRTIVYKGMFLVNQLRGFYLDLQSENYASAIAMVHSRFSTNTTPSWERAHPNRMMLHNGEINTIRGNVDRMYAREETMSSPFLKENGEKIFPVIHIDGSDSAMLDNTLEFLIMNGMDLPLALMVTIPEPWQKQPTMPRERRDLYRYYATMMEPWDGPAAILCSDGDKAAAVLDRNGLRPSRYYLTDDDRLILSSEVGVLDIPEEHIIKKAQLQPGKLLLIDTVKGRLISDDELKTTYSMKQPYGEWLDNNLLELKDIPNINSEIEQIPSEMRKRLYKVFGYTYEEMRETILPMAKNATEIISAMGTDVPLAVLSEQPQSLFNYFQQLFAQVTNPPIDAIREECVTDTSVYVGSDGNLLEESPKNCHVLHIHNPILTDTDIMKIKAMNREGFHVKTISLLYTLDTTLQQAVENLFNLCDTANSNGANILILSDRGVDENHLAIPSLLAVSAMEQHLIRIKKRTSVSVILESAEPCNVHHFALLLGFGARAVFPYLAHECIKDLVKIDVLKIDSKIAIENFNSAIINGIVKIASKMGISTIQSYQSAQIFEAVGIKQEVIDKYFTNTVSRVGGIGLEEIDKDVKLRHRLGFNYSGLLMDLTPDSIGYHRLRSGEGKEDHLYNPLTITALREATQLGSYKRFKEYSDMIDNEKIPHTLRSLLDFKYADNGGIPIEEVEPVESIVHRFKTGAMSYGSISKEAHECMAIAMNRLGGKSNSGEGGEEPDRLGTERGSAIKQVASARFGVTSEYLVSAKEIQIKMAQGAKPGEGGHLPSKKVYPWIAKTRYSTPGVALISPPPHHDIYSIEDLAQLIYDLKNANRNARISVKLVSEAGVGTIASGVAKAGSQVILISGFDGGTGAAPKSSIHNAGLPWELGISETHKTLIQNGLRSRVVLETDGKLMTGRDVAIAAMLGAEEFGFATAPLVTMGCLMMRVCNLDTCPIGIATQNPDLRCRFTGKPEYVMNFMKYIAEELREYMAKLGIRSVNELVGRSDLLKVRDLITNEQAKKIDFSKILTPISVGKNAVHFEPRDVYDFHLEKTIDETVLIKEFKNALEKKEKKTIDVKVKSTDRTFGTILGSEITKLYGNTLSDDTYTIHAIGTGGQSFGSFIPKGLTITLEGDSNDHFGKGLSGGKLILYPSSKSKLIAENNIIVGNVALYGATSGYAFIRGIAGERFCVRNSGANAVVEGVGDHGCEYMTGGRVVVLGKTGKNFAAGMSGGIAYVLDVENDFESHLNKALVTMSNVTDKEDINELRFLIEAHKNATHSTVANNILSNFTEFLVHFKKVIPNDYERMLKAIHQEELKGYSHEEAELNAFNNMKNSQVLLKKDR